MNKQIEKTAVEYQKLDRQIKELEAKLKPLKTELLDFAKDNKDSFDDAFQLKFKNGTYISLRVSDAIDGDKDAKVDFALETEMYDVKLDEKLAVQEVAKNERLRKLLTKHGLRVVQKETFAVYAS